MARYTSMDVQGANKECGGLFKDGKGSRCPTCRMAVILHCGVCEIQVTGCVCTARERMSPEDFERFKSNLREQGLMVIEDWED